MVTNNADQKLDEALERATNTRANFLGQVQATKNRLNPQNLKQDAIEQAEDYIEQGKQLTLDTVKAHPVVFGSTFLGTLAFWYRRPIAKKSPDILDSIGDGLSKIRDWIAPHDWTNTNRNEKNK